MLGEMLAVNSIQLKHPHSGLVPHTVLMHLESILSSGKETERLSFKTFLANSGMLWSLLEMSDAIGVNGYLSMARLAEEKNMAEK